ncbi:MAG: TonB-dependent receptor, partial [Proteobacteria bacterium]|nr:TonB-dependent receptor [Pseudomonadota bacterium]
VAESLGGCFLVMLDLRRPPHEVIRRVHDLLLTHLEIVELVFRLDWSYRDKMFGQPFNNVPITDIDSRTVINFDIAYHAPGGNWLLGLYGRNVTDEKYDNARILPVDYVLQILNNDRSEFGLRFMYNFGL